ncbi:transcriptional regulator GcvA [Undibacterium sp. TS12]|uniref:transcriptional regulator GcvA n=1 Tax=Undibacterium sp. TS12 TaxID=2908202 RepID=UPI001F4CBBEB|nr:transcriptional regulator GcvA [Undibacterium sp. TS12]MCH8617710.1 transcriptional regulator GcvA [Undibacterium sp. TS12]
MDFRRLPNLAALRAFEAAARHQNFSRAAEEIHLTHGAISHQVRALEEELGVALFIRHGKRITITADGEQFAAKIRQALQELSDAADMLKSRNQQKRLGITALPSFAARWLSPRLGRFIEHYPDLEVSLQSSSHLTDYNRESIDIGIRFGLGNYPGMVSELLMGDYYYPVASPNFHDGHLPQTPAELASMQLLRCDGEPWEPWFRAAGLDNEEPGSGLIFQDSSMLARAAVDGQGIALGRHIIVQPDIKAGLLKRLFDIDIPCEVAYYLVYPPEALLRPQVKAFREWLLEEIAEERKQML